MISNALLIPIYQGTFQCCNIGEARRFYDAMVPLAPIMLALSGNCPIVRGFLVDRDCRWNMISAAVDTRRDEENHELSVKKKKKKKKKNSVFSC